MAIIVYIWNKRKMKAYKTDRTNQGETIHIFLQSSAFILLLRSLPLMSTPSFENLLFPINHLFPGPGRWSLGKNITDCAIIIFYFLWFSIIIILIQLFSRDIPIHRHMHSSPSHWPSALSSWLHFLLSLSLFQLSLIISNPAGFKQQRYGPLPGIYTSCILYFLCFILIR